MIAPLSAICLLALLQADAPPAPANPEIAINRVIEELRKGELLLDAISLEPYIGASVTIVEDNFRLSGSFAYLEGIRRLRERGGKVQSLTFTDVLPRVFGDAAVVTYRYEKVWVDNGVRHREAGWCTDVLVRHEESGWLLVERHRAGR